jgi:hypothetical protein
MRAAVDARLPDRRLIAVAIAVVAAWRLRRSQDTVRPQVREG